MIRTAVILAAGQGKRLGPLNHDKPKGFLEIEGEPIIEQSVKKLLQHNFTRIIIGTGFSAEYYNELAKNYPQIHCVKNEHYAAGGSLHTLKSLKNAVGEDEDILLLESDLIYEGKALKTLLEHPFSDVVLAGPLTKFGDEVFIESDQEGFLVNLSKNNKKLNAICGEFVGINKLSYQTYQAVCEIAENILTEDSCADYEQGIVAAAQKKKIYIQKLEDLTWCEIDTGEHLDRAIHFVYPMIKEKEKVRPVKRNVLLNPGPATTTDTVKYAQVVPDICPREEEFGDIMDFISHQLTTFVGEASDYAAVLFAGSGTAAVEAILSSVIDGGRVLIINNGAYGERMLQIATAYGIKTIEYQSPLESPIDLAELEKVIKGCPHTISHLAAVHHETTTGLLNDVSALGNLCREYKIDFIVDGMSSFAAIPIDMANMNISYLAASSNKNLQGMAGLSFVIADRQKLEGTKEISPRNFYLNLYQQYKYFSDHKQMRFTPPVQTLYALKQAVIEVRLEGIETRYARYKKAWETLVKGIERLGLSHIVSKECHSKLITAIQEPHNPEYDFNEMHDYFYKRGFTIYPGKIKNNHTFRIANIGQITYRDIEDFLQHLENYLRMIKEI